MSIISALCEKEHIDINSTSEEELQKITEIGPVYAERIIQNRPFKSVDELIKVKGIAEIRLGKIKDEGLACVNDEILSEEEPETKEEVQEQVSEEYSLANDIEIKNLEINKETHKIQSENPTLEIIKLTPKSIKSQNNTEKIDSKSTDKNKYALYGFMGFCVLLAVLFILEKRKNRIYKNEFREN